MEDRPQRALLTAQVIIDEATGRHMTSLWDVKQLKKHNM
ncbi:hypothetical protein BAE44_0016559 [Dichanthelium oligosanthes]|uniref:Uncharacterized protein n=1 Tax=Dichanthelium oligosanthes TaxID=888268 RepID=A0A1E5VBE3_9POAL|nr:hypothetical protein BAE44_0016559 [Dichanthelium oligosanthes]